MDEMEGGGVGGEVDLRMGGGGCGSWERGGNRKCEVQVRNS